MPIARFAILPDRGVVSVTGEDAEKFLQGLITNDMERLATAPALFAGLLTPQGKILFDFFVVKNAQGFLLDVARGKAAELAGRLAMYKLRAKVEIADVSKDHVVAAAWGLPWGAEAAVLSYADPRHPAMWNRLIIGSDQVATISAIVEQNPDWELAMERDYDARRVAQAVPEGGKDYAFGDAFPHEANFDLLNGVDFDKGCYVGQEVVSRMQNKTIVRKRVARITLSGGSLPLAAVADVKIGEAVIGKVGTVAGPHALALLRLDRAIEAAENGIVLTAGDTAITVDAAMLDFYRKSLAEKAALQAATQS